MLRLGIHLYAVFIYWVYIWYSVGSIRHLFLMQIREGDMKTACEVLARDFRITREESLLSQEIIVDPQNIRQRSDSGEKRSRQITHSLTCLPNTFCITSMDRESIKSQALTLIGMPTCRLSTWSKQCLYWLWRKDVCQTCCLSKMRSSSRLGWLNYPPHNGRTVEGLIHRFSFVL